MDVTYVSHGKIYRCYITLPLVLVQVLVLVLVCRGGGEKCSYKRGARSWVAGIAAGRD